MSVDISLKGMKILITRPVRQAIPLAKLIIGQGGEVINLPVVKIRGINNKLGTNFNFFDVDIIIFVSCNAVNFFLDGFGCALPISVLIIAVGKGTAATLQQNGITNVLQSSEVVGSEGGLMFPELGRVGNKKIIIVRGLGGLKLLADTLVGRGAKISYIEVYERILSIPTVKRYTQALTAKIIICTSVTGVMNLVEIFSSDIDIVLTKPLIVLSARIKKYAISLGFEEVLVSLNTDNNAILHLENTEVAAGARQAIVARGSDVLRLVKTDAVSSTNIVRADVAIIALGVGAAARPGGTGIHVGLARIHRGGTAGDVAASSGRASASSTRHTAGGRDCAGAAGPPRSGCSSRTGTASRCGSSYTRKISGLSTSAETKRYGERQKKL